LSDTLFQDCFFNKNKFSDCKFDETVSFDTTKASPLHGLLSKTSSGFNDDLKKSSISGIYRGIKEAFLAGQVYNKSRKYLFWQNQEYTRYNRPTFVDRASAYFWEFIAGYGLRPVRVLLCLVVLFRVVFLWFAFRLHSAIDSLLLSAGAFLTFGAKTDLLERLPLFDHTVYITSAFIGVALVALFVTVMANVQMKDN